MDEIGKSNVTVCSTWAPDTWGVINGKSGRSTDGGTRCAAGYDYRGPMLGVRQAAEHTDGEQGTSTRISAVTMTCDGDTRVSVGSFDGQKSTAASLSGLLFVDNQGVALGRLTYSSFAVWMCPGKPLCRCG
ncbi:hypothetical protein LYZ96_22445 [Xanthomonas hortorum pv. vitians]|uniref:hypothetical protein n=1 Tax=Xanthomonas hortorum TaxID=56454 RepID=UPI00145934A6|nr:hypothetical protein [Xanthomonas hortorum]MCE4291796.1 hypothetical protein [Xanthomonas hortorum pv. vitians]MCE4296068.1 hypothetical protein [Xanthomonas hortorum pv. vitians]MDT7854839.1 hypothetical protein [Xanthomonas hortorum pv. vitians]NMI28656.1 hypothetical protein [Xanthomonas hortorum pv. vitians]NMI37261.1 hypothetical protein [Xanthomonas hortorum pv. vitians]